MPEHHDGAAEPPADETAEISENESPAGTLSQPDVGHTKQLDITRQGALWWILGIFTLVMVYGGVAAWKGHEVWANTKEFIGMILPVLTGILGTVIGFYFGRSRSRDLDGLD